MESKTIKLKIIPYSLDLSNAEDVVSDVVAGVKDVVETGDIGSFGNVGNVNEIGDISNIGNVRKLGNLVENSLGDFAGGFEVQINPETLSFNHKLTYKQDQPPGDSGADQDFDHEKPMTLEFEVIFDRTGAIPAASNLDLSAALTSGQGVNQDINALKKVVLKYEGEIHRPKKVKIVWGKTMQLLGQLTFRGQLTNLSYVYKKFNEDGVPVRATVSLAFQGVLEEKLRELMANKKSPDITRSFRVRAGDTLPYLAYRIYGDSKYYMKVAIENNLLHFRDLQPGQELIFPPIE